MPTITEVEVKEEKPAQPGQSGWKGKGATIYIYTVEGDMRRPEDFVVKGDQPKKVGDVIEIEDSDYGPKVKKGGGGSGGGFKRSSAETAAIQRQHSQNMALLRERNIIASGGAPFTGEQLRSVINWFDKDIKGKDRAIEWDGLTSDIPADMSDFDPKAA